MRDHLNGGSEVFSAALLIENVPVDLACGQIGIPVQILIDESFVMPQIKICFSPVFGHVHLTVLIGAHRSRVHIDIGIQFLGSDLETALLEEPAEGRGGDPFSKPGDHASGHKNVFCHDLPPVVVFSQKAMKLRSSFNPASPDFSG